MHRSAREVDGEPWRWPQVAVLLFKHAGKGDVLHRLAAWKDLLRQVGAAETSGLRGRQLVVEYILRVANLGVIDLGQILNDVHPDMQQIIETTASRLKDEGRAEGRAESLLRLLARRGFTVSAADREQIMNCRDEDVFGRWLDRLFDAQSLADVLDG